jgi:hypothetical protein
MRRLIVCAVAMLVLGVAVVGTRAAMAGASHRTLADASAGTEPVAAVAAFPAPVTPAGEHALIPPALFLVGFGAAFVLIAALLILVGPTSDCRAPAAWCGCRACRARKAQ